MLLDCREVGALSPEHLTDLLSALPPSWDVVELGDVIVVDSLSEQLAAQLIDWMQQRHGRTPSSAALPSEPEEHSAPAEPSSAALPSEPEEHSAPAEPSSANVPLRDQLEQLVIRDLLGPANGPNEIIAERTVRGRYLVGMLAPRNSSGIPEEYDEGDSSGGGSEDGIAEAPAPKASSAMLPSSIGLTFSVAKEAQTLVITARWGSYQRVRIEDERWKNADGSYRLVWKRTPVTARSAPIPLREGKKVQWSPSHETPDVQVQGLIRQRPDHWVITLFLINGQQELPRNKDSAWVFQPELSVAAADGAAIFQRRAMPLDQLDTEEQLMAMSYRHQVEFAVGHGVAVDADIARQPDGTPIFDRAVAVRTSIVPVHEVPQTTPPTAADAGYEGLAGLTVDMQALAELPDGAFSAQLAPLAETYATWIARQALRITAEADLQPYTEVAQIALARCRDTLTRIRAGIALLDSDRQAAEAFRFANRAMALQRMHSLYAANIRRGANVTLEQFDTPEQHSWRAFQLGFLLINLPALTDLSHPERTLPADQPDADPSALVADLLWFPTGGGKTEAYLGLTAYTLAIRRLQGVVAGRSGHAGVAVLMRYTLRLLTLQQFQRAAALICACETIRRSDVAQWGSEPFRVGLWVGERSTPNRIEAAAEAITQIKENKTGGSGSPIQLQHCPWCGSPIDAGRNLVVERAESGRARVITYCSSLLDQCAFNQRQAPNEGLPVMVVDEEIYHRLPALLIATVDKFAQMPWNGRTSMLFGNVDRYCDRHGYLAPDIDHPAQSHPLVKSTRLPPASVRPVGPLRPPDLIIQDELHLISGPLGTLVGLYESAIDYLTTWRVHDRLVRPKVIASTATIRRAEQQVHSLFLRRVNVFPPQGLDASDNYFSIQRPPSATNPGRCYMGICAPGIRHKTALIQVYIACLAAAQQLYEADDSGNADPWMTLVGYFNSLRELAAMRRSVDDSVTNRLRKMDQRGLAKRSLTPWSVDELTSRLSATEIPKMLDRLETPFDPQRRKSSTKQRATAEVPIDVLLATNMISVGVDVSRLGLMVVAGQPKATAEYIQATSRVGRRHPGLVATVYNWTRPRDLSHYERFNHYHATFYQYVEALSVTPFSLRAIDRGLSAVLAAMVRLGIADYNANQGAGLFNRSHPAIAVLTDQLVQRASYIDGLQRGAQVREAITTRLDHWAARMSHLVGARLGYDNQRDGATVALLQKPSELDWGLFTCLNSMRDVEPTVNLILEDRAMDGITTRPWTYGETAVAAPAEEEEEQI
jgi:hypothetical protein